MYYLLIAIKSRFESGSGAALRAIVGDKYYLGVAPQGTGYPALEIVTPGGNTTEETISRGTSEFARHETVNVDFIVHDVNESPKQAWDAAEKLKALYDGQILSLGGSLNMIDVRRQGEGTAVRNFDDDGWSIVVTYQYTYG